MNKSAGVGNGSDSSSRSTAAGRIKDFPLAGGGKAGPRSCSNTSGTHFASAKEARVR